MRYKDLDEIVAKYAVIASNFSELERRNFLNVIVNVSERDSGAWNNYGNYRRMYGGNSMEMLLGDFFGVKIVDMNQRRAEKNMERLTEIDPASGFDNFSSTKERFRDHRQRVADLRPGGVHYVLTDREFPNYPIEVMFRGIKDELLNLYGKHRHDVYSKNGKRANPIYKNKE